MIIINKATITIPCEKEIEFSCFANDELIVFTAVTRQILMNETLKKFSLSVVQAQRGACTHITCWTITL